MKLKLFLFAFLANFFAVATASAAPFVINWTGTITEVNNLNTGANVGDTVSGSISFDDTATGFTLISGLLVYTGTDSSVTVPTFTFPAPFASELSVSNNQSIANIDGFSLSSFYNGTDAEISVIGRDDDQSIFSSTALSELIAYIQAGDFSALELLVIRMTFDGTGFWGECTSVSNCSIVASVDSLSISEIPLPAALPFFLAGVAGLGFLRRSRKSAA